MKTIQWGIIGCGDVTEIKSGPAFNLVANSKLMAVMRRDGAKAEDYAKRHGVPKWYSSASDLINDPEVNAIYIATPPSVHEVYALEAFAADKPVYVEKPMALNAEECFRMEAAANDSGCKLSVAHYRREQPRFKKILELLDTDTIGKVISVRLDFRQSYQPGTENTWRVNPAISGGGLFHDLAPHQLDLMLYFFGLPVMIEGTSLNRANLYDADDYASAYILFENNLRFEGTWDFNAKADEETDVCEIIGSKGSIRFAVFGNLCELTLNGETETLNFDHLPHVQQPMIDAVVQYFLDQRANPCSGTEAAEVMRMMDVICGE